MNNETLNKICAVICIVTVVLGTILAFALIWGGWENKETLWKMEFSIGVLFIASAVTLSVSKTLGGKENGRVQEKDDDVA